MNIEYETRIQKQDLRLTPLLQENAANAEHLSSNTMSKDAEG